jgi:hypothetical protein
MHVKKHLLPRPCPPRLPVCAIHRKNFIILGRFLGKYIAMPCCSLLVLQMAEVRMANSLLQGESQKLQKLGLCHW